MAGMWDCYCAICSGIMRQIEIRQNPPKRRDPDLDQKSQSASDAESEDEDEDDDDYGYDPTVLRPEDVEWILNCRALGLNLSSGKVFMSGPGSYDIYGSMTCGQGDDPNSQDVEVEAMSCYFAYSGDTALFPFHWDCARILSFRLTGSLDLSLINKQALFRVMDDVMSGTRLDLEYTLDKKNDKMPTEQEWVYRIGEEYYVSSPLPTPEISSVVRTDLKRAFTLPSVNSALSGKVKSDPFSAMPQEITDLILCHLDHESLMSVVRASWPIHCKSHQNNGFWKRRILDQMPWFFELRQFLESEESKLVASVKGLYLWARKVTMPRKHLRAPYTAVANRRRMWNVCNQIAEKYDPAFSDLIYKFSDSVPDSNPSTNTAALPNPQTQQHGILTTLWNLVRGDQM